MRHFDSPRINFGEERLLYLFKEVGPNMRTLGSDIKDTYLVGPWQRGDNIQKITGPVVGAISGIFDGIDKFTSGVIDQELSSPHGFAGRTHRDIENLLGDVMSFSPAKTIMDVVRLPGDLGMDGLDALGGFRLAA